MAEKTTTIVMVARDMASGNIAKVRGELGGLGTAGKASALGLGGLGLAAHKVEGALGHAKSQVMGLASNLGILAGGAGLLGVGAALTGAITKTEALSDASYTLSLKTGESVQSMSALLAVADKVGIGYDALSTTAGMYEKAVGKLSQTTASATTVQDKAALQALNVKKAQLEAAGASTKAVDAELKVLRARQTAALPATKLIQLQQEYGVTLTDSAGKALPFSAALMNVADAYSKATTAAAKANVAGIASQIFGRGYQNLAQFLALGKQGILDAEAEAQQMGLVLTAENVKQLADLRQTQRQWNDVLGGLEIQAGLTLVPMLTDIGKAANKWLGDPGNRESLIGALKGVEGIAQNVAGSILAVGKAIAGIWGMIPSPLQQLLIGGFVAQKASHWLFGSGPLQWGKSLLGSLLGKVPVVGGIASAVAGVQHVWVDNMPIGGIGGAGGLAAGAAEAAGGTSLLAAGGITAAALAVPLAISVKTALDYRSQQDQLLAQNNLTRAEAVAYQIYQNGGMDRMYGPARQAASNALQQMGTSYAAALASALAKIAAGHDSLSGIRLSPGSHAARDDAALNRMATKLSSAVVTGFIAKSQSDRAVPLLQNMAGTFQSSLAPSLRSMVSWEQQAQSVRRALLAKKDTYTASVLAPLLEIINASILRINPSQGFTPGGAPGYQGNAKANDIIGVTVNTSAREVSRATTSYQRYTGRPIAKGVTAF